jgi:hypothetical protein
MVNQKITGTIIVGGKSAEMGTPEAEKLIAEMVAKEFTQMSEGVKVDVPQVFIGSIKVVDDKKAGPMMVFDIGTKLDLATMSRLWNLKRQGPIQCQFYSPQAVMDLKIEEVNVSTGEVKAAQAPAGGGQ